MENKEKYIADQIRDHREEVDLSGLWSAVSTEIPRRKKRRGFVWMWSGIGLLGLAIVVGLTMSAVDDTYPSNPVMASYDDMDDPQQGSREDASLGQAAVSQMSVDPKRSEKGSTKPQNGEMDRSKARQEVPQKPLATNSGQVDNNRQGKSSRIDEITNDNTSIGTDQVIVGVSEDTSKSDTQESSENQNILTASELVPSLNNGYTSTVTNAASDQAIRQPLDVQFAQLLEVFVAGGASPILLTAPIGYPVVDICSAESRGRFSMDMAIGAVHLQRSLRSIDEESMPVRDRRSDIEEVLGGWNIQMLLKYRLTRAISISIGGEIFQAVERSSYRSSYLTEGTAVTQSITTYLQDGSIVEDEITTNAPVLRETNEIRINRLTLYQIPLVLRYTIPVSQRLRVDLVGEGVISLAQDYTGFTSLSATEQSYDLRQDSGLLFRDSGTVSYRGGIDLSYALGGGWSLVGGSRYGRIGDVQSLTSNVAQHYSTYALQFGINYKL